MLGLSIPDEIILERLVLSAPQFLLAQLCLLFQRAMIKCSPSIATKVVFLTDTLLTTDQHSFTSIVQSEATEFLSEEQFC